MERQRPGEGLVGPVLFDVNCIYSYLLFLLCGRSYVSWLSFSFGLFLLKHDTLSNLFHGLFVLSIKLWDGRFVR